jgi:hypothetical protein
VGIWVLTIFLGICTLGSFYMTFLAAKDGDSRGAWLFASFGLLFGTPIFVFSIKEMAKRKGFFKTIDERISGKPEPRPGFVPHWFMMGAIILTVLAIVVSILIKIIR